MSAVQLVVGDDGILVATMDLPGRPMNVVGDELMLGIARAVERLADPAVQVHDRRRPDVESNDADPPRKPLAKERVVAVSQRRGRQQAAFAGLRAPA